MTELEAELRRRADLADDVESLTAFGRGERFGSMLAYKKAADLVAAHFARMEAATLPPDAERVATDSIVKQDLEGE